ncbi:MAG: hypothetical protein K2N79_03445, partial [Muribaculaceae bacterium]|nr:hypothetical protein [Muribaculaceae bacterium]
FNKLLFYWIVITLSTSLWFATSPVDNRNYILIGTMFFGPFVIICSQKFLPKIDITVFCLMVLTFAFQYGFHYGEVKTTSILYSCMFYCYFLAAIRVFISAKFSPNDLQRLFTCLIIAYAMTILIQQTCVLFELPRFNPVWRYKNPWKLNSLAAEPSHSARILGVLMYGYLIICDLIDGKRMGFFESCRKYKLVWTAFFWTEITMFSGTAMIIIVIVLARYVKNKNILLTIGLIAITLIVGPYIDFAPIRRSTLFLQAFLTGDTSMMIETDWSASARVVPFILCLERINLFSIFGWIGAGSGSTATWMSTIFPNVREGWISGGLANYTLEYGLILGTLFIWFSGVCCFNKNSILSSVGLWIMCVVLVGVNMQIVWLCMLVLFLVKNIKLDRDNICVLNLRCQSFVRIIEWGKRSLM